MKKIGDFWDALARHAGRRPAVWLVLACWTFFAATAFRAGHSAYWLDELITVHISALPAFPAVWNALRAGIDLNPPLQYAAVRASHAVFGAGHLATRLPMLAGYLLLSVCLYLFLRKRVRPSLALAGMMLPWLAGTYRFAMEARPYGILLGCSGAALLCWSRAAEPGRRRAAALIGLWASLTAALLTHCYAVLLALPFGLAELRRFAASRKPDWPMWLALAASALPIASYPMLLGADKGQLNGLWPFHVTWLTAPQAYRSLLEPLFWPLVAAAALLLAARRSVPQEAAEPASISPAEFTALAGFALIPAAAVLMAAVTTKTFEPRYGAPGIVGIACLLPWAAARYAPRYSARCGAVLAAVFFFCFAVTFGKQLEAALRPQPSIVRAAQPAAAAPAPSVPGFPLLSRVPSGPLPLVMASAAAFLEAGYYASPELSARMYYVSDPEVALRRTGSSGLDCLLPKIGRMLAAPGHVEAAGPFLEEHRRFLVYYSGQFTEWMMPELAARGWSARVIGREGVARLAEVTAPGSPAD